MINAVHSILFASDAEAARRFFADVLELDSVDAGDGWLIFALPPAELAAHPAPADGGGYDYLMTDDLDGTLAELRERGVTITSEPSDQGWGVLAAIEVPGVVPLGLYQPRHPVPRRG
jgi:catechol 2,3-dioxygenase-like lactoylglutathione lyase family enzyme